MASERTLFAKEDRRLKINGPKTSIDTAFLVMILLLLAVGLIML